ncbi:hypothetical protein Tco_0445349 [Tanacetum coccineum]
MDDEPMWATDRVVAQTPGSAITIPETANEFAIKGNIITIFYHGLNEITQEVLDAAAGGIFLYKTPNQSYRLLEDKVLLKLDWDKNQKTKSSLKKTVAFAEELQSRAKQPTPNLDEDDMPLSHEEEAKFMQTFHSLTSNLVDLLDLLRATLNHPRGNNSKAYQPPQSHNEHVNAVFTKSGKSYDPPVNPNDQQNYSETPINFDSDDEDDESTPQPKLKDPKPAKETPIDVIDEILEEDFNALLDEGSKILYSIEGTSLEEEIFFEIDKFIAMAANENYDSESDEEEPKFEKITINTDYKIKTSLEEPPMDLKLKRLPDNLEYVFLEEPSFLPVIISSHLSA